MKVGVATGCCPGRRCALALLPQFGLAGIIAVAGFEQTPARGSGTKDVMQDDRANDLASPSEEWLIRETQQGRPKALDALLERHLPALRVFVRLRLDRELRARESEMDVVQSVCRELLAHLGDFEYRGEAPFRKWLYVAALNKLRQKGRYYRAEKRDHEREHIGDRESILINAYESVFSPSRQAMAREQIELLEAAFDRLPDDHREVITLARVVRLPHSEIANAMGRTVPAVKNLLARALVRLTTALSDLEKESRGGLSR